MATDVKVSLAGPDYQLLKLLLRWQSGKLSAGVMQGALVALGYKDDQVTDVNRRLEETVKWNAERLGNLI